MQKLEAVKEEKLIPSLRVGPMIVAIYSGAMDSILQELIDKHGSHIKAYQEAYDDLIKTTGSSAKLPKKKKNEFIGLDEVKTDAQLAAWRNQNSPIGVFRFIYSIRSELEMLGFKYEEYRKNFRRFDQKNNVMEIATDEWEKLYSFIGSDYWDQIQRRQYRFHVIGVVTSAQVQKFHTTKEMFKVSFFTGKESVTDVVLWPEWGSEKVNPYLKMAIKQGEMFLFEVVPTFNKGKKGGKLVNAKPIGRLE